MSRHPEISVRKTENLSVSGLWQWTVYKFFSLALMVEALWANIGRNCAAWKGVGHFERKFPGMGGRPPTNFGVRKRESLGYHMVLFAQSYVQPFWLRLVVKINVLTNDITYPITYLIAVAINSTSHRSRSHGYKNRHGRTVCSSLCWHQ